MPRPRFPRARSLFTRGALLALALCAYAAASAGNFRLDEELRIRDPEGRVFVPIGANVTGQTSFWPYSDPLSERFTRTWEQGWRFNTMRVCTYYFRGAAEGEQENPWTNDDIVRHWTRRNVVVILVPFDFPNKAHSKAGRAVVEAQTAAHAAFWAEMAARPLYRNNPYVWFNIANEVLGETWDEENLRVWVEFHRACIAAIRGAGAENMIVVDGMWAGQDLPWSGARPDLYTRGAVYLRGREVVEGFENVIFGLHPYGLLDETRPFPDDFVDRWMAALKAKGLRAVFTELGLPAYWPKVQNDRIVHVVRRAAETGAGALAWHWSPGDGASMTSARGGRGEEIDRLDAPTNLSPHQGRAFWDIVHVHGFGLPAAGAGSGGAEAP